MNQLHFTHKYPFCHVKRMIIINYYTSYKLSEIFTLSEKFQQPTALKDFPKPV